MFSKNDISYLQQSVASDFVIYQLNGHDVSLHSIVTGHDWIIISCYDNERCFILHRHNPRCPYHRQQGGYSSLAAPWTIPLHMKDGSLRSCAKCVNMTQKTERYTFSRSIFARFYRHTKRILSEIIGFVRQL